MLANCKSCCPLPTCFCIDDAVSEDDEIKAGECCQEEEELQKSPGAESEEVVGMNSPSTSPSTSFASSYYRSDSLSSIMIEESADTPAPSPSPFYPADLDDKGRGEGVEEDDNEEEEGEDILQLVTDPASRFFKRRSTLTPENANTDILLSPNSVMLLSPSPLTDNTTTALRKISTSPPNSSPTPWAIELSYFGIPLLDMRADPYVASGVPFFVAQLTQFLSRHFKELYALGGMVQNTTATAVLKSKGSTPTIRLSLPAISTEVDITPTKPPCYKQRRLLMDLIASSDLFFFPHVDDDIINDWSKKAINCDGKKARKTFPIRHLSFAAFSSSSTAVLSSASTAQTSIKMEHPILLTPASLHSHMACLAVSHIMSQIDMIGIEAFLETSEIKLFPHLPLMETNDETNFKNSFLVHKNVPYSTGSGGKNEEILHRKTLYSDLIFLVFLFLEKLPASLIPHKVGVSLIKTHDKWLLTHRGLNAKEKEDFRLLHLYEECLRNLLPTAHYNLVAYMLTFLRDLWIQSGRDEALMENLVTCFSCTTIFLQGGDLNDTALVDFNSASEDEMDKDVGEELSVLNPQTKRSNQSFYTTGPNSLFKSWRPIVRALLLHCTEIFAPKLQFSLAAVPASFYISAPSSPAHMTTAVKKVVFVPPPNKEVVDNLLENNDIFNEPSMKQTFLKICKGEKTFILPVNQLVNKFAINPYRITTNKRSRSIDASYFSPKIQPSKSSPDFLGADGTFIPAGGSPSLIKRISLAATTSTNQSGIGNPMQCVQARLYNAKRFIEKHRLSCSSKGPVTFDDLTVRGLSPTLSLPAANKTPSNISFTIGGDDSLLNNIFNSGDNSSKDTTNNPLVAIKSCLKGFELFETVLDELPEEVKPMDAIISHFVESDSEITEDNDDTWTTNSITSSESDELSASLNSAAKLGRQEITNLPPNENFSNISLDNISDQEEEESVFKGYSFEHDDMDSPEARRWRPGPRFSDEKLADWNASFATSKTENASHSQHYRERGLTFSDYTFTKFGNEKSLPASSKSKPPHNCAISRNLENEATDCENESSHPSHHHHRSSRYSYPPSYMTTCSNKRSPKLINKRYSFEEIDRGQNCFEEVDGMPPPSPPASHDPYSHYFDHLRLKNDILTAISPKTESNQDLNSKLQAYQKKLKHHEELFERKNGHKPSHIEKLTVYEMKKYINKIDKLKKDIKALKIKNKPLPLSPFIDAPGSGYRPPNLENVEPEGALPKNPSPILTLTKAFRTYYPRLCDDFLLTSSSSFPTTDTAPLNQNDLDIMMADHESKNINDALILDLLDAINKESLYKQKLILQKVLLNFESVFGKPPYTLSSTVSILKPLYCKYRRIKNAMSRNSPRISMPDLPTIIEGHPWDACTETTPNIIDRLYGTKSANVSPLPMQSTLPPHPHDLEEEEGSEEMVQKNSIFVFSPSSLPATIKNTGDHEESSGSPPHKLTRFTFSPQITSPLTTNPPIESCRVAPNTTPEPYSSKRMKDQGDKAAVASHLREITNGLGLDTSNIHSASLQELLSERRKIKEAKKRLKNLAYIPLDFLENHRRPSTQDLPDSVVVDIVELTKQQQQHQPPLVTMGKLDDLFDNDFMLPPKGSNHKAYFVPNLQYYEAYKMAKNKLKLVNALIVKLQNKKSNTLF